MRRRSFIVDAAVLPLALLAGACTTSATMTTSSAARQPAAPPASDTGRRDPALDGAVDDALDHLYANVQGARELVGKASGALVFPKVYAAGFGVGGQFGQGSLRAHASTLGYYSLASLSVGLQIGAQSKTVVILFMTPDSLAQFRASHGWSVGGDASVAVLKSGVNGNLEMAPTTGPVVAFVLTNAGLMANLTLAGTKITPRGQG